MGGAPCGPAHGGRRDSNLGSSFGSSSAASANSNSASSSVTDEGGPTPIFINADPVRGTRYTSLQKVRRSPPRLRAAPRAAWAGRYQASPLRSNGGRRVTCAAVFGPRARARVPAPWSARSLRRLRAWWLRPAAVRRQLSRLGAGRLPPPRPCDRRGEDGEWQGERGASCRGGGGERQGAAGVGLRGERCLLAQGPRAPLQSPGGGGVWGVATRGPSGLTSPGAAPRPLRRSQLLRGRRPGASGEGPPARTAGLGIPRGPRRGTRFPKARHRGIRE